MSLARPARLDPEDVAIAALSFIAADPERLSRFLGLSGLEPATLRAAAAEPGFLAQVMEYVAADESLLLAFAANAGHHPEAVAQAARKLGGPPGGDA